MQLLINGDLTDEEIQNISANLKEKNIKVSRYYTFSIETKEIVKLLFRDFDAFTLLRDGVFFIMISWAVKRAINLILEKKKDVEIQTGIELVFRSDKKTCSINIRVPLKNTDIFWKELENTLTLEFTKTLKFTKNLKDKEITSIIWDNDNKKLKIIKF